MLHDAAVTELCHWATQYVNVWKMQLADELTAPITASGFELTHVHRLQQKTSNLLLFEAYKRV